jgi:hypothetical protein
VSKCNTEEEGAKIGSLDSEVPDNGLGPKPYFHASKNFKQNFACRRYTYVHVAFSYPNSKVCFIGKNDKF